MIAVRLPDGRTLNVQTEDPQEAAQAGRRVLAREAILKSGAGGGQKQSALGQAATSAVSGATLGMSDVLDGLQNAGITGAQNLILRAQGKMPNYGMADAYAADRGLLKERAADHPVASGVGGLLGSLATPGAGKIADFIAHGPGVAALAPKALRPVLGGVEKVARSAIVGAPVGAVSGAANADPGHEVEGAGTGAKLGAVAGAAVPIAGKVVGSIAAPVVKGTLNTVARTANRISGGALLDANRVASQRLVSALKADGATPEDLRDALNGFMKNGATSPVLVDIASRLPSGGQNTLALVRGASATGAGRGVATQYADQVGADLQDKAIAHTQKLTPDTRPAVEVRKAATDARGKAADAEYRAPYATTVDAKPVLTALEGDAGRLGLSGAYKDADALRLHDQTGELDKLRAAAGPETPVASIGGTQIADSPGLAERIQAALGRSGDHIPVSLGTLDRVKVALNDAGQAAARGGENSRAAGFFQRAAEIDDHLAGQSPEYSAARDNFSKASAGIDALDHGATGMAAAPDEYAATLAGLKGKGGPEAGDMAGVGYRQALTDAIGAPTATATGTLNRAATATNQGRNLTETYGPEVADTYQGGLKDLTDQFKNARYLDPGSNSQTAGRLADLGLVQPSALGKPLLSPLHIVMGAISKIRSGLLLTDEERGLIAKIGTSKADLGNIDLGDPALEALRRKFALSLTAPASNDLAKAAQ